MEFLLTLSLAYRILPSELPDRLTASDYAVLSAYHRLNPFGPRQETRHAAAVAVAGYRAAGVSATADEIFPSLRRSHGAEGMRRRWAAAVPDPPYEPAVTRISVRK